MLQNVLESSPFEIISLQWRCYSLLLSIAEPVPLVPNLPIILAHIISISVFSVGNGITEVHWWCGGCPNLHLHPIISSSFHFLTWFTSLIFKLCWSFFFFVVVFLVFFCSPCAIRSFSMVDHCLQDAKLKRAVRDRPFPQPLRGKVSRKRKDSKISRLSVPLSPRFPLW